MLSFELSAIDLVLAIAVIILLILSITKSSVKTPTEEKLLTEKNPSKKPVRETTNPEEERKRSTSTELQTDSTKCPYGFGHLKKLDKDASIPDRCLGCSRIMECCSASE